MARVTFTQNIQRHVACPTENVNGKSVREVLDGYFALHPAARSYVLDEQGNVRTHMVIFVDAKQIKDRHCLDDELRDDSQLDVMQALSGG